MTKLQWHSTVHPEALKLECFQSLKFHNSEFDQMLGNLTNLVQFKLNTNMDDSIQRFDDQINQSLGYLIQIRINKAVHRSRKKWSANLYFSKEASNL